MISEVRCAFTSAEDKISRCGGKDEAREPKSCGWDTCADMSRLSTALVSGHGCLFLRRNGRRQGPGSLPLGSSNHLP
jgi:hypothetical protein